MKIPISEVHPFGRWTDIRPLKVHDWLLLKVHAYPWSASLGMYLWGHPVYRAWDIPGFWASKNSSWMLGTHPRNSDRPFLLPSWGIAPKWPNQIEENIMLGLLPRASSRVIAWPPGLSILNTCPFDSFQALNFHVYLISSPSLAWIRILFVSPLYR